MTLKHDSLSSRRKCSENVSHGDKTGTTSNELDLLFSLMFDELLNGSSKVVSKSSAVSATDAPNQRQQHTTPLNNHTTHAPTYNMANENVPALTPIRSDDQILPYATWGHHNINQRSGSPVNRAEDDRSLGNLKFVPKGKIDKVFGMKIPEELIKDNIKNASHYNTYLEMVAKHERGIMAAKEDGKKKTTPKADNLVKPTPAKQAKPATAKQPKPKPVKEKPTKPTPVQNAIKEKDQPKAVPKPQGTGEEYDLERAIPMSLESFQEQGLAHVGGVAVCEPVAEATHPLSVVECKGKAIAMEEQAAQSLLALHTLKGEVPQTNLYSRVRENLSPVDAKTGTDTEKAISEGHLRDLPSSSRTLSSMKNLDDTYTFGDQFFNEKSTEDEPRKQNVNAEVVSMVNVLIHQASTSVSPLSTPIIDLSCPKPAASLLPESFTAVTTETNTITLLLPPPPPQQSTIDSELTARITTLEKKLSNFEKKSQNLDNATQNLGSRVFNMDLQDLPHKINQTSASHSEQPVEDVPILDDVNISDLKDTDTAHLSKIKTRHDWLKPIPEKDRPRISKLNWIIPLTNLHVAENNWADALAKSYKDLEEKKLLSKTIDMRSFIKWFWKRIGKKKLRKSDLKGPTFKVVRVFHKNNISLSDFGLEELVPSLWIENERHYNISATYTITYWWFNQKDFYITRHNAPPDHREIRSHMWILSITSIKTFERYDYALLREILIRRDDHNEDRNDQKMQWENKVHKFSDDTLTRVLYKLDHMVKDFRLYQYNLSMEVWKALLVDDFEMLTTGLLTEHNDIFIPILRRKWGMSRNGGITSLFIPILKLRDQGEGMRCHGSILAELEGLERMRSIISMVSISLEGFLPSILLLVVIVVAVVIVAISASVSGPLVCEICWWLPLESEESNIGDSNNTGDGGKIDGGAITTWGGRMLKSNPMGDRVMRNNSQGKKHEVEDQSRNVKFPKNKMSVTACNDSLNAKTLNVNSVSSMCDKCVLIDKHDMCVLNSVAKPIKRTVASESNQKPRNITRKLYERVSKTCSWWYSNFTPSGYKWKPKTGKENVNPNLVDIFLFIIDSRCSKYMTGNLKLLIKFVEKFLGTVKFRNDQIAHILRYGDLVQGVVMIKRVYCVEGLNHNLFSVGQLCDADLEVAFRKSTCYIRDLKGNDLLA
nr:integrase, catalytic region, zinc finger, CCHC-type, peptidase aspartic, catalytic [Tanacetum cinerariifolium]